MGSVVNMLKRSSDKVASSSKYQRLEEPNDPTSASELNIPRLEIPNLLNTDCGTISRDLSTTDYSPNVKSEIDMNFFIPNFGDDTTSSENSCQESISVEDYLNIFFKDMNFESALTSTPASNIISQDESFQERTIDQEVSDSQPSNLSKASDELQSTTPPTNVIPQSKTSKSNHPIVFREELSDCIFLILKLHNRQFHIHIREFKRSGLTSEEILTKNGIIMDVNSWFEFCKKIFSFNLRYKSSSFVSNNMILVLNFNNSIMRIKNLKNYSHIDLNEYQLLKLKEKIHDLNKELLQHIYVNHIPSLIRQKCIIGHISTENELMLQSKLITCIENNVLTILNRIFECDGCIFNQKSQSPHSCCILNNRQKFEKLGEMLLTLIDLDFVISSFLNGVDCVSENFLSNIHVETIQNELFKIIK